MAYKKYYLYKEQYTTDDGETWVDVEPLTLKPYGMPIATYDTLGECNGTTQYRWVNLDPTIYYYCDEGTKYYKQQKQVSYDSGTTWENVVPEEYQQGAVAEEHSTDCGVRFSATYSDSTTYSAFCDDSSTVLSSATTRAHSTSYTAMTSAIIGDCVTAINTAFTQCTSLTSVTIPNSIISIGRRAFESCSSLTSITIPNSVKYIGQYAFEYCSGLTSVDIPDSVLSIGGSAFDRCTGITSCTIGSGVTSIGAAAFEACISLTSVAIPSGVTYIDSYAFRFCRSLTSITCLAETPPTLRSQVFLETNNCPIYVPAASVDAYKAAWVDVSSRIQAIP